MSRARDGWAQAFRAAPLGVLLLGVLIFLAGAVLVVGGVYQLLTRADAGWFVWVSTLLLGPGAMYVALHLIRRTTWAWRSAVLVLALLIATSVERLLRAPDFPRSAVAELVAEGACLAYLLRPPVRRAFGRS